MEWHKIDKTEDIDKLQSGVLIFKHSPTCPVSRMALKDFEKSWKEEEMAGVTPYMLLVIAQRDLSNYVSRKYHVAHESPQILIIQEGKCVHHASHDGIQYEEVKKVLVTS